MVQLAALGVQNPQINALGAFQQGAQQQMAANRFNRQEAEAGMQQISAMALGVMDGDIKGKPNPQRWEQALDLLASRGVDVQPYRGRPDLAPVVARSGMTAMQQMQVAQSDRQYELALSQFSESVKQHAVSNDMQRRSLDLQAQAYGTSKVPSGYRATETGNLEAIPGGPYDPNNPLNTRKVTGPQLSATAQKELFEADERVQAGNAVIGALDKALELNDKAYSGFGAESRGYVGSLIGKDSGVATEELRNIITSQALDQLKSTFGSMPTEGERKILLEIQGSVNQAPEVRKGIYERARAAAERRVKFAQDKASQLRSGEYFTESPGMASPAGAENGGPQAITSQQEYEALPPGAEFIFKGQRGRKPAQ